MGFMNYRIEIIGLFFSSLVAVIFWKILMVPERFFIAPMIAIIFFLAYRYVVREEKEVSYNSASSRLRKALFSCFVVLSVLSVLLIHPITETVEFISWNAIPPLNILRLLLSSFLTLFSPGYMTLSLMDKNGKLTATEKMLVSILISLLILPFLGLLSFALGSSIQQFGIFSIILLNVILLMPYIFINRERPKNSEKISFGLNEKLVLISLLVFMSILMLAKFSLNLTWDYGDVNGYFGYSVSFTKGVLPLSPIGPGSSYPYWPFVFLAQFFIVSGVPYVNAFQFISILITFLPIFSFYVMVSAFFEKSRHKKIPIIATLLGFFGEGLGLILGANLLASSQAVQSLYKLFDIMARTNSGYLVPAFYSAGMYPLYTYTLTSVFALIWLIYSKRANKLGNLRYGLIPVMIALGYFAHVAEIVFFLIIFLASILIFKREDVSSYRKCAISIFVGLILIALPDIILKGSFYTEGNTFTYYGFSLYYAALALAVLAVFSSFIKNYLRTRPINIEITHNKTRALKIACLSAITYFYGLSLIIWAQVYVTYGNLPTEMHTVPWYVWPDRLGIIGLLALPGIIYLVHKNKSIKEYSFFILLILISFLIARVLHLYPSFYYEDRLTFFIMIPTVILAAYTIVKLGQTLLKHVQGNSKSIIIGFVLSMILVSGFLPGLLTEEAVDLNYWTTPVHGQKLLNSELDALNFLRLNTPPNGSVLTLTIRSNNLLSYAGLSEVQTYVNRDPSLIFTPSFPETAIYSLAQSQVKYVYLSSADKNELEQNPSYSGFVRDYLLKYLPIAFQNEEVTIYEVPDFSTPTSSNTALVTSNLKIGYLQDVFNGNYDNSCRFCSVLTSGDIVTVKTDNSSVGGQHDFKLPVNVNPNEYPYVTIRWKTDGTKLYFYLVGAKTVYYISLGSSTSWQTTVINLQDFYDFVRNETFQVEPNEQIGSLIFEDSQSNSEYSIDSIGFYKVYPLPPSLGFANALSTYSENNVEANGIGSQTGDLHFRSTITLPVIHSSDVNVRIIANYTMNDEPVSPYALTKSVGNGEVTCLAVLPYFSAIENPTSNINRDFFKNMGSLLNVADPELNKNIVERTDYFPQFDFTKDPVNFTGKVSIDTDFIQLPNSNASSITIVSNNGETKSINFTDSAIEQVEYVYPVKFRIDASAMQLVGTGIGSYLNFGISGDFNLTMEIPKNSNVNMSIWNGQTLLNETFQDSNIQLSIKNGYSTIVSVKNPTVTAEGNAYFSSARIYRNYYKMPLFYDDGSDQFEVIGNVTFKIAQSDNGINFVDNFAFNGKWVNPTTEQTQQPSFTEMDIPWLSVLTSPFHVILVTTMSAVLAIYALLRLKKKIGIRLKRG
jgi:hypothetical protein